jgi:hypothetical protein
MMWEPVSDHLRPTEWSSATTASVTAKIEPMTLKTEEA